MTRLFQLSDEARRRAMRSSVVEGGFYAAMVGFGELYFVANAVRLGAAPLALGMVVALPLFVGALGAIASHALRSRGHARKRTVLLGTCGQVAVLTTIVGVDLARLLSPWLLIALVCGYHLFGQITGVAWASWFGDIVPEGERGSYFAGRNRVVHAVTCVAALAGGGCLHLLEAGRAGAPLVDGNRSLGFVVIFAAAAFFRLVSTVLLARTPEPESEATSAESTTSLRAVLTTGGFGRRIVAANALLYLGVYIASPYFAFYMLKTLKFTYLEYTIASVASVVARVALLPAWGRLLDHHAARSSYFVALIGIAILPFVWLVSGNIGVVIVAQILSGAFWGGHELALFTMILESVDYRERTAVFASVGAVAGTAQLAGTLLGAALLNGAGFAALLIISGSFRLAIAGLGPLLVPAGLSRRPPARRRVILMRLAGLRPSGGLTHRPFEGQSDESSLVASGDGSSEA